MEQQKKKKKKGLVLAIVGVILVLLVAGFVSCARALTASLEQMSNGFTELSTAERRDISDSISVSGSVESENMVKITSTLAAKVSKLYVELGSEVQEGDILVEFDSTDLRQQYDTLKATLDNSNGLTDYNHKINERNLENARTEKENTLAQAQRTIDDAVSARDAAYDKERQFSEQLDSRTAARDALSAQLAACEDPAEYAALTAQYQEAELNVQSAQAQLDAMRDQLPTYDSAVRSAEDAYAAAERSADAMIQSCQDVLDAEQFSVDAGTRNELDKLADAIESCTVRAPKSGIITSLNVAEGSLPTAEALMTIEDKDALKITVQIAEQDILRIKEGMSAVVTTTATGEQEFAATVSRVVNIYQSGGASFYGQTSEGGYSAEITINDRDTQLLIGMNAKVRILLAEKKDVLSVPYESIVQDEDGTCHVLLAVTDPSNGLTTARAAKVEPGMEGAYYTEITSDEVKEGDRIVMSAAAYKDGDMLLVMPNLSGLQGGADE